MTDYVEIAVVDDHPLFLDGLTALVAKIGEAFRVVSFTSGTAFLEALDEGANPSVIIADLSMKPLNGLAVLSALQSKGHTQPMILISGYENALSAEDIAACGAFAFVPKSASFTILQDVIHSALRMKTAQGNSSSLGNLVPADKGYGNFDAMSLTARQMEIVQIVASGGSNRDVATQLNISENTVKTHLRQIFDILGVNNRTACVDKARSLALI